MTGIIEIIRMLMSIGHKMVEERRVEQIREDARNAVQLRRIKQRVHDQGQRQNVAKRSRDEVVRATIDKHYANRQKR